MIAVDTNILVYAYWAKTGQHQKAVKALKLLAEGSRPWAIPCWCLVEFLRVVTHPRILTPPASLAHATQQVENLLASPNLSVLVPRSSFGSTWVRSCREGSVSGNLVYDAAIVALCQEWGISEILSEDRDLDRFPGVRRVSLADA